jgi:hypothetical protein
MPRLPLLAVTALVCASLLAHTVPAAAQPSTAAGPARTRVGAFVTSLADISETQRRFDITFWVWLLSPRTIGTVNPAMTLEITNAATMERQYSVTTETPSGRTSQVKFRASVRARFEFRDFPFDHQRLRVNLEDAESDIHAVEFVPDVQAAGRGALSVSRDLDPQDWAIGRMALTTRTHREPTTYGDPSTTGNSEYSRVVIEIDIARRHSMRILINLLLGTFMSLIVAFFAVLLPIQQSPPRYTLLSGAIFVCISNRLLVDSRLPGSSTLGLLDQMQLCAIVGLLALTGLSLLLTNLAEKRVTPARATQLSQRLAFTWIAVVFAVEVLLVLSRRAGA